MIKTLKVLSALLSYPTEELQLAAPEMRAGLGAEGLLPAAMRRQIDILIEEIAAGDLYNLQERYVLQFDRTRSLSLHLFEHVHGESRDRGQAMINLKALYEKNGLLIDAAELPDFLPLFLEFLSTRPVAEAYELLGQPVHILSVIAERLRKRHSPYEAVFRALVALSTTKPKVEQVAELLDTPDPDPSDFDTLDAAWEDEPVAFGPGAANNCKDGLITRVRAARRPAAGMTIPAATRPVISRS
jgi:nitrate reductase delta subunit